MGDDVCASLTAACFEIIYCSELPGPGERHSLVYISKIRTGHTYIINASPSHVFRGP